MKKIFLLLFIFTFAHGIAEAQLIDKFPEINITDWIMGNPGDIGKWGDGKVYVIELWGTWCLPCIKNIPVLTELQKKYKEQGLVVVGYSWEEPAKLKRFVKKMGDKMKYVLINDSEEKTLKYLAEEKEAVQGFPYSFVINRKGNVVWQGSPEDGLPEVLDKIFAKK